MVKLVTPLLLAALAIVATPATASAEPDCHRVVVSLQQVAQPLGAQVCRPEV